MASELEKLINQEVYAVAADGRCYNGLLKCFDQTTNIVIENCKERLHDQRKDYHEPYMGTFLLRGENVVAICEVNKTEASKFDNNLLSGENIPSVQY